MMNIGDKLKMLRENSNMTRKEAVDKLKTYGIDISDKTLYGYESGRNSANADMFLALCQVYRCNNIMETFSDSIDDVLFTNSEWELIEKYRDLDTHGKELINIILDKEHERCTTAPTNTPSTPVRLINYYYRLASAGTGQILFDMPPTERIEIPDLPQYRKVDYAIGVNGDSMQPTYYDGDMLLVEMTNEIEIGEIGIFSVDGDCYVKELGNGELISLNEQYNNIPLNETAKCMGRVIDKL